MNKIKLMLYSVTVMFSVALLCPLTVHAEFMPPTLPDMGYVPDFLMTVGQYEMLSNQGFYTEASDIDRVNQMVNGRTIQQSMQNHYVDNSVLPQLQLFYDSNGNLVAQDNTYTVFGTSDITEYTFVADKRTGEILFSKNSYNDFVSTLNGGKSFDYAFDALNFSINENQQGILLDKYAEAMSDYMVVYSNQISEEDARFLESYEFYATWHSNGKNYTCYVPNACTSNTVVICTNEFSRNVYDSTNAGDFSRWSIFAVTNNPSEVFYSETGSDNFLIQEQKYFYGYQFNYISKINVGYYQFYSGGYIDFKLPTSQQYAQYRQLSDDAVYIQPAENSGTVNNYYNYTYVTENPLNPNPTINNNYNNTYPTNYNNYPVTNNYNVSDLSDRSTTYVNNIYNYYTQPKVEEEMEANPEEINNNIPIISNLQNRFPFSIPWDIAKILNSLNVQRQAPVINAEITFPVINYTWNCSIDLSMFESSAELFRKCVLILFVVGLAVFSYSHHFGS